MLNKFTITILIIFGLLLGYSLMSNKNMEQENQNNPVVVFKTSMGDIEVELFKDKAPNTVDNFTKLATEGFYNGTRFHRVIENFMIQGGDPLSKDVSLKSMWGTGDPGYKFADEIHSENVNSIGTIAMANSGPNTNGSQFFINVADNNWLDGLHTVFGKVVVGVDIVIKISQSKTGVNDQPVEDIIINSVELK
jgi:cyclophilin family peptidyl-prolyl cis-trans isomerase